MQMNEQLVTATASLYVDLIALQQRVPFERIPRPSVLTDPEPSLRTRLLRAGAAWLIGWASILAALHWGASL